MNRGLCYHVVYDFDTYRHTYQQFFLSMNKNLTKKDRPRYVDVIVTSQTNHYGVINLNYVEGEPLVRRFSLARKEGTGIEFSMKTTRYQYLTCSQQSYYQCLGERLKDETNFQNCSTYCTHLVMKALVDLGPKKSMPICRSNKDNFCSFWSIKGILYSQDICPLTSCHHTHYYMRQYHFHPYENESDVEFILNFPSTNVRVYDEYLVYDMIGVVASIGGSLGLFIGFSFKDLILCVIDKIFKP